MSLDRHTVTRTDFPMSRRGYDRIAVDRHLDEIAQQLDTLQRPSSVGATTSAQVQSILDAAEASAAEIERRAWEDASRVQEATDEALARARAHITALGEASHVLRQRIEGLLAEVETLDSTLGVLEAETPEPRPAEREPRFGRQLHEVNGDGRTEWFTQGPPAWTGAAVTPAAGVQEARESARLVALNMADGGQPRQATDAYLSGLYAPGERAALLDEIYGTDS